MTTELQGKICMVTGANSGIGKATALELARRGATVVLVARSRERGEAALAEITRATGSKTVELMLADLSSQASIRELAAAYKQKYNRLHVLVNNAGAFFQQRGVTVDGYERTFALNHLGYFLLTNLLLDVILASAPARIVNVSSAAHAFSRMRFDDLMGERKYSAWLAYGQSKLANVLFTVELNRRLAGKGVTVTAMHPGFVRSNFASADPGLSRFFLRLLRPFTVSPEQAAETSVYLATATEVDTLSGRYFANRKPVKSSRESTDLAVAARLWQVSEKLTGLA